jgi:hypothetical protein
MESALAQAPLGLHTGRPQAPALFASQKEAGQPFFYSETPLIKSGEHNLKNIVISVLSRQWPLSARRVYKEVCSDNFQITYQGVHKALRQLREQGIVLRTELGHQLDRNWIDQLEAYSGFLRSNYALGRNTDFYAMLPGESACLQFDSYFQAVTAILEMMGREHEKQGAPDEVLLQLSHPFPILGLPARTLEALKRHSRTHSFCATYHSPLPCDLALCRMWNEAGVAGRISRKGPKGHFNVITRGILIQLVPSPRFARRATSILSTGGSESLLQYTRESLQPHSRTLVTITQSPGNLAQEIRREKR